MKSVRPNKWLSCLEQGLHKSLSPCLNSKKGITCRRLGIATRSSDSYNVCARILSQFFVGHRYYSELFVYNSVGIQLKKLFQIYFQLGLICGGAKQARRK